MNSQQLNSNKINCITHFGPFIVDVKHAHNSFLIQYDDLKILIDIPPIQVLNLLKVAVEKERPLMVSSLFFGYVNLRSLTANILFYSFLKDFYKLAYLYFY